MVTTFTIAVTDSAGATAADATTSVVTLGAHDIAVKGPINQYEIARDPNTGNAVVADTVTGRDGTQTVSNLHDIFYSDGIGRFDATGNAEEAARLYQAAFGRAPDSSGLDYWAAQLDSGTLGLNDVALSFIDSSEFTTRYGSPSNQSFVQQLYQNVLHRSGESSGVQFWTTQLNGGTSRAQVLVSFSDSIENKTNTSTTIGDKDRGEAYRLYQAAFNRTPDTSGLNFWTTQLDQGTTSLQVAQGFVNSNEFAQQYEGLDTRGFVDKVYQNVLHRTPDASGEQFWVGQLNSGGSKAQVLLSFSDSPENRLNTSQAAHDGWVYVTS